MAEIAVSLTLAGDQSRADNLLEALKVSRTEYFVSLAEASLARRERAKAAASLKTAARHVLERERSYRALIELRWIAGLQDKAGDRVRVLSAGSEPADLLNPAVVEAMREVYPKLAHADPEWMELREFYCPSCARQLETEAVPPGYPVVHEFLPDVEGFYRGWLGREIP